jgi:RHS repeat-associated protein
MADEVVAPLHGFTARYRPDVMRAQKVNGLQLGVTYTEENEVSGYFDSWATDKPTTRYYYDGQTPFAEDYLYKDDGVDKQRTTVYVPGLRGCDGMRVSVDGTQTAVGWPIYDTHGNNVGMFKQENDNLSSVNHERRYDAWGAAVWQTGDPPMQGYCAAIGHRKEPESELVYMRARYYEPSTGRFISEDPAYDGANWYVYCASDPVNYHDKDGRLVGPIAATVWLATIQALGSAASYYITFMLVITALAQEHPAFNPTPDWIGAMLGVPLAFASALLTRPANFGFPMKVTTLLKHGIRYFGVGGVVGAVLGAYAARMAFEMYYAENFSDFTY